MSTASKKAKSLVISFTLVAVVVLSWLCSKYLLDEPSFVIWMLIIWLIFPLGVATLFGAHTDEVERDYSIVLRSSGKVLEEGFHVHWPEFSFEPPMSQNPAQYQPPLSLTQVYKGPQTYKSTEFIATSKSETKIKAKLVVDFSIEDVARFVKCEQNPYGILENASYQLAYKALVENQPELDLDTLNRALQSGGMRATRFALADQWQKIKD